MFIPRYWAEASRTEPLPGRRQATVRRFGWSSTGQGDAEVHARQRVEAAVEVLRAGGPEALEGFTRRERKVAYAGADGLPIREEIVREWAAADVVLTRNGYGALCLNTTRALFVDVDVPVTRVPIVGCLAGLVGAVVGGYVGREVLGWNLFFSVVAGAGLLTWLVLLVARWIERRAPRHRDPATWALERARAWCEGRPVWRVAVYETPAGARLLALHAVFDAGAEPAHEFMRFVGVDPLYERMCRLQKCFRARVSPKPWRAGISDHFRAGGVWPVTDPHKLATRAAWVQRYERATQGHASCRLVEVVGEGRTDARIEPIRALHDDLCRATSRLPLA